MHNPPIPTPRQELVETIFGEAVADPFRWLEDGDAATVKSWIAAQNRLTRERLDGMAIRPALRRRLEELFEIGELSLPTVCRTKSGIDRYLFTRREGNQNQPVLWVRDGLAGEDRVLFDPNRGDPNHPEDGNLALDWYYPSLNGSWLAYGTSTGGTEQSTLRIVRVDTREHLPISISRTRHASVAWKPDDSGFFYTRLAPAGSVPRGEENYRRRVHEHHLGEDPEADPVVFDPESATAYPSCQLSPDGRWLLAVTHHGWNQSQLFLADASRRPYRFVQLTRGLNHLYSAVVRDDALYVLTDENAPRYALYAVDPRRPGREDWKLLLSQHPSDVLSSHAVVGDQLLVSYLHDGTSRLERFDLNGKSMGGIGLPALGTSNGFAGFHLGREAFFDFESFAHPRSVHRLDLATGAVTPWQAVRGPVGADSYRVMRNRARSRDGTWVPYWVVHRADIALDAGENPTLLYGYGGFDVSLVPRFSRTTYLWLERGGVYVEANLRGGGEYGEEWHRAGQLEAKQNVFDDFIAVAQKLTQDRITRPEKLAIYGRSNGGLLTLAALTQRPELFGAVVSGVPLADMVRYHRFLLGRLWEPEYGSPEDPAAFRWLLGYSPYHRVRPQTRYPAVLITTAEGDQRVEPLHARKMVAMLQSATSSDRPVLLRTEESAGHGAGKPTHKVVEEYADLYAFILAELGEAADAP